MSYDVVSEEGTTTSTVTRGGNSFARSSDTSVERLSGYSSATSSDLVLQLSRRLPSQKLSGRDAATRYSPPAPRDAIRRELIAAQNQAMNMETAAEKGALIDLANAGFSLRDHFDQLWTLRLEREADWGDLLNLVQGALRSQDFERYTAHQCQALRTIIVDQLASGIVDIDDLQAAVAGLREANLDPFAAISDDAGLPWEE